MDPAELAPNKPHEQNHRAIQLEKQGSNSSSSSSSGDEDDFFQLDPARLASPLPPRPAPVPPAASPAASGGIGDLIGNGDMGAATNPFLTATSGDPFALIAAQQSPSAQFMARSDGPLDPNRIPSSIFARTKSTTPMEWSVASNESLFSIHLGNNSFSRDHAFLIGRSGELANFSGAGARAGAGGGQIEPYPIPPQSPAPVLPVSSAPTMPVVAVPEEPVRVEAEETNSEAMKDVMRAAAEEHKSGEKPLAFGGGGAAAALSTSVSRNSDGSGNSFRSFAFQILTGDVGRNASVKVEAAMPKSSPVMNEPPESQQSEAPAAPLAPASAAAEPAPAARQSKWFPCFSSCYPSCCRA